MEWSETEWLPRSFQATATVSVLQVAVGPAPTVHVRVYVSPLPVASTESDTPTTTPTVFRISSSFAWARPEAVVKRLAWSTPRMLATRSGTRLASTRPENDSATSTSRSVNPRVPRARPRHRLFTGYESSRPGPP